MQNHKGMPLFKALKVQRGAVVSFVGGGGKTTSMFRLAGELSGGEGLRVVTTTTTHISSDQLHCAPCTIRVEDLFSLASCLERHGHCLVTGTPDGRGRVFGIPPGLIADLIARPDVDVVLVEADGSRSLPFKAPADHEPVVPDATTILAPVVGLNSIGTPLDDDHVHRAGIAAGIAGVPIGSIITEEIISRVLTHPDGGAKQLPAGARLVPILNKADTGPVLEQGRKLADLLATSAMVDAVAISSMLREPPVIECRERG
jgi:molybdenum cofactor cytidylyltransferase